MTSRPHSDWIPYRYGAGPPSPLGARADPTPTSVSLGGSPQTPNSGVRAGWWEGTSTLPIFSDTGGVSWKRWSFLPQLWDPKPAPPPCLPGLLATALWLPTGGAQIAPPRPSTRAVRLYSLRTHSHTSAHLHPQHVLALGQRCPCWPVHILRAWILEDSSF